MKHAWHSLTAAETIAAVETSPESGLSATVAPR
jgi:hypothetical protein